ncbi:MAG TPA: hypothetical protein VF013_02495, partial [Candidatus Limnocylindria bacterium]
AATTAALLAVLAGGLGWIRLVGDMTVDPAAPNAPAAAGDLVELIKGNSYDNQWLTEWPYFSIPSVLSTGLLAHRATTAGLPILVGAMLLLVAGLPTAAARRRGWRDRPLLIGLAGVLGALLAPFHFFYFPAFWLLALLYVVGGGRLTDARTPRNALAMLAPLVLAAPFALTPVLQASGSGALKAVLGWESAPLADGPAAVAFFYVTNLGVPFLLAVAALLVPRTPWRLFLGAWVAALFAIPNLLQFSVIAFDMNKYFQAMWIAVALLAAWLIRRWPWPAVGLVLLLSVPSPLLVAGWTAWNREQLMDWNGAAAAEWIADNTPGDAVFATDGWLNSPTDAAGRLRLLTYTPYVANLGYDPDERARQVHDMYCAGDVGLTVRLMRQLGADYLLDAGRPADCTTPTSFGEGGDLVQVYANPGVRIYRLQGSAAEP